MGAIPSLIGAGGGAGGTGFAAPAAAGTVPGTTAIQNAATTTQANTAYNDTQNSMASQNALLAALQGQNGLGNQNQVYSQLQGIANGTGPNPAQAMLNQSTGQNVANQAALMAGQRGASANVGLMARQAAQQGAATQQQAVGQAATQQANQSLNAISAAGSLANQQAANQIGQTNANTQAQQAEQSNILNAVAGQNNANVSMASNINNANAGLANTQLQGQQAVLGSGMQAAGSALTMGMGGGMAEGGDVDDGGFSSGVDVASSPNIGSPNFSSDAGAQAFSSGKSSGSGGSSSMMSMLPMLAMAMAEGGTVTGVAPITGATSSFGQFLAGTQVGSGGNIGSATFGSDAGAQALGEGLTKGIQSATSSKSKQQPTTNVSNSTAAQQQWGQTDLPGASDATDTSAQSATDTFGNVDYGTMLAARGGLVPAYLSKGERVIPPSKVKAVADGLENPMRASKRVPGKPEYPGNDYRNDVVPAKLQESSIVIPNKVLQSKNPEKEAIKFVQAVLAKRKK
jgi:hypothetical protein